MNPKMFSNQICQNCRYFVQHYGKMGLHVNPVSCGHCSKTRRQLKNIPNDTCEKWEPAEISKAKRKEDIEETIRRMAKSLEDIAFILKEDQKQ